MRVLIADDQKSVGPSLAELVKFCKHEVVEVVGSGLEAIQANSSISKTQEVERTTLALVMFCIIPVFFNTTHQISRAL